MHSAKGLESPVVLVMGLNDNVMPLRDGLARANDETAKEDLEGLDRERKLLYVAMSRACEWG